MPQWTVDAPTRLAFDDVTALRVRAIAGSVAVLATSETPAQARTVSGDVEAQDVNGQVSFNSVSGDLTLAGGSLDRLDAKTVTGSVTADVHLGQPGQVRVATVSSDVALRLPAEPDARVRLRSTSGQVLSEFDCLRGAHGPAARSVNGTLGAGSGQISVTTLSGRVTLLKRPQPAPPTRSDEPEQDAPTKGEAR
jgi:DUF4097 and DUF4098 domain-containing protein YvlB